MVGSDGQLLGLATLLQHAAQTVIASVNRIGQDPSAGRSRIERRGDQMADDLGLGGKNDVLGHVSLGEPRPWPRPPAWSPLKALNSLNSDLLPQPPLT